MNIIQQEIKLLGIKKISLNSTYPQLKDKQVWLFTAQDEQKLLLTSSQQIQQSDLMITKKSAVYKQSYHDSYVFLDKAGLKIQLPDQLIVPYANYFAKRSKVNYQSVYIIDKVFKRSAPGAVPHQYYQVLVANASKYQQNTIQQPCQLIKEREEKLLMEEAQKVALLYSIFSRLYQSIGNFRIRITHTALIDVIFDYAKISMSKHQKFLNLMKGIQSIKSTDLNKLFRQQLDIQDEAADKLVCFMKLHGSAKTIRNDLQNSKQTLKYLKGLEKNEILQNVLQRFE